MNRQQYEPIKQIINLQPFGQKKNSSPPKFVHQRQQIQRIFNNKDLEDVNKEEPTKIKQILQNNITPFKYFHRRLQSTAHLQNQKGSLTDRKQSIGNALYPEILKNKYGYNNNNGKEISFGLQPIQNNPTFLDQTKQAINNAILFNENGEGSAIMDGKVKSKSRSNSIGTLKKGLQRSRMKSEDLTSGSHFKSPLPTTIDIIKENINIPQLTKRKSINLTTTTNEKSISTSEIVELKNSQDIIMNQSDFIRFQNQMQDIDHETSTLEQIQQTDPTMELSFGEGSPIKRYSQLSNGDKDGSTKLVLTDMSPYAQYYKEQNSNITSEQDSSLLSPKVSNFNINNYGNNGNWMISEGINRQVHHTNGQIQSETNSRQQGRRKGPLQNKKLKSMFKVSRSISRQKEQTLQGQSYSFSKFLTGIMSKKNQNTINNNENPNQGADFREANTPQFNQNQKINELRQAERNSLLQKQKNNLDLTQQMAPSQGQNQNQQLQMSSHSRNRSMKIGSNSFQNKRLSQQFALIAARGKPYNQYDKTKIISNNNQLQIPLEQQIGVVERLLEGTNQSPQNNKSESVQERNSTTNKKKSIGGGEYVQVRQLLEKGKFINQGGSMTQRVNTAITTERTLPITTHKMHQRIIFQFKDGLNNNSGQNSKQNKNQQNERDLNVDLMQHNTEGNENNDNDYLFD